MPETMEEIVNAKGRVVVEASPQDTVADAIGRMYQLGVGSVVVTNDGVPCGMLTKRDVLTRIVVAKRNADETMVADIMSNDLVTVSPTTTIAEAMELMNRYRYRHLPVVQDTQLKGLVAKGDLTRWLLQDRELRINDLVAYITR